MTSLNKIMLIGRLGDKPTLRYTQNQKAVANFSLATSQKAPNGQEQVEWHKIIVWDKVAENCEKFLSKGKLAYVEGRIQTRSYLDKQGQKVNTTEVIANAVQFLSPRDEGQPGAGLQASEPQVTSPFAPKPTSMPPNNFNNDLYVPSDDIPF